MVSCNRFIPFDESIQTFVESLTSYRKWIEPKCIFSSGKSESISHKVLSQLSSQMNAIYPNKYVCVDLFTLCTIFLFDGLQKLIHLVQTYQVTYRRAVSSPLFSCIVRIRRIEGSKLRMDIHWFEIHLTTRTHQIHYGRRILFTCCTTDVRRLFSMQCLFRSVYIPHQHYMQNCENHWNIIAAHAQTRIKIDRPIVAYTYSVSCCV